MAFCIQCGATIKDGAKFCPKCGAKQEAAEVSAAVTKNVDAVEDDDNEEEGEVVYAIHLKSVDPARKMDVLKKIRSLYEIGLSEAKYCVDTPDSIVAARLTLEEAQKAKREIEASGATVSIEEFEEPERDDNLYDVFLMEINPSKKQEIIEELTRASYGMDSDEAEECVDNPGSVVAESVSRNEAESMKSILEDLYGATVSIELAEDDGDDDDEDEEDGEGEDDDVPDEGGEEVPDGVFRQPNTQPRVVEEKTSFKDTCLGCGCLTVIAIVVINVVIKFVL
ncbi:MULTISPECIES: ribosomal protein L7/L12 [unclassified Fibrobacter]|uniref:ribosomal protein L7/L12 n=1 Tax=unclassified Fibrobacter TaxID=2634177 RepID=UPI0025BC0A74|nr:MULTISPECIES: ribosomal protein L7/L12 [unclassified Fibrobacter]